MTASSTSAPTEIASPPRVMVLTVMPKYLITATADRSESGSARRVIKAARKLARKEHHDQDDEQSSVTQRGR